MIIDRRPNNTDNDNYIRQWAIDNNLHDRVFITRIRLIIQCKDEPNIAIIHWAVVGQPVRRHYQ